MYRACQRSTVPAQARQVSVEHTAGRTVDAGTANAVVGDTAAEAMAMAAMALELGCAGEDVWPGGVLQI